MQSGAVTDLGIGVFLPSPSSFFLASFRLSFSPYCAYSFSLHFQSPLLSPYHYTSLASTLPSSTGNYGRTQVYFSAFFRHNLTL
jgi:hypothetical protein